MNMASATQLQQEVIDIESEMTLVEKSMKESVAHLTKLERKLASLEQEILDVLVRLHEVTRHLDEEALEDAVD